MEPKIPTTLKCICGRLIPTSEIHVEEVGNGFVRYTHECPKCDYFSEITTRIVQYGPPNEIDSLIPAIPISADEVLAVRKLASMLTIRQIKRL